MDIRVREFILFGLMMFTLPFLLGAVIHGAGGAGSAQGLSDNFALADGNKILGSSEAKRLEIYGSGAHASKAVVIYVHSDGSFRWTCFDTTEDNCDKIVRLVTGKKFQVLNNAGSTILDLPETGSFTTLTFSCTAAGVNCTTYRRLTGCGGDLVGIDPASGTAGHIWNRSPTLTAPTATAVTGTNVSTGLARHPDSAGDYGVQVKCRLPANVTIGQVDGILTWYSQGTGNYRPQVKTKCYADEEAADAAFNSAQPFTVAVGTAGRPQIDTLSNITMTGCAAGEILVYELLRNRAEASDTGSSTFDVESFELWAAITE